MYRYLIVAISTLLVMACVSNPVRDPQLATVNNKYIEYAEVTIQSPRIIFINGGGPGNMNHWGSVYSTMSQHYSVFAYNRFGSGRSSRTSAPQTGQRIVTTLHQLLEQQNLHPPYVLVGHSLGGLYANLYAREFPQDVAGVVLVDPTHPQQFKRLREQGVEPNKFIMKLLGIYKFFNPTKHSEVATMEETGRQVQQAGPFPNIPLTVITAGKRQGKSDENRIIDQLQRELAMMSPKGMHLTASESGHMIQKNHPQIVIQSIQDVIGRLR